MKKRLLVLTLSALVAVGVTGCGSKNNNEEGSANANKEVQQSTNESQQENKEKKITYLGKEYTVPSKNAKIVITGTMESMEDALMLDVKPLGAITVGGEFPAMFKEITAETKPIGEKIQPNIETILSLKPDIILGSTKFPAETLEKLNKVKDTIPVSHISTDWEDNLMLMGQLSGKEDKAKEIIEKYKEDAKEAKEKLGDKMKDKKVVTIRIRSGNIFIYPETVFFNPVLYNNLGLTAPEPVKAAKAQEEISLEKFSELNPDYIFVQFSENENADKPKALEELNNNPIWKSINAVKEGKVFVNTVDPLGQGGTAWSKSNFLKAAVSELSK
ncbi:iron-uptake system-binding protein [Clostridium argentinense CDC 2741]|uniref:Iron-uptake system-binding protein n=1 Tax=Clostridium argentinense CDC 2741 TaxID=1418104 RepID=A0A0C1TVP0_9CLOT|nr:iron-hydroxamate ABC transporter substrate-binding protein [Clostridium argentinense]ARC86321.1 iron-uptake system-binding protein [Clostridium argentinense]KIE44804.1 iron-uptake system-binding protein [Clostridium argentinense CDC 2741]NFF40615.1 iron-hydroxamate ABC transporter substrate-binding protein [Clostridium argentinense]NFP51146.1 iron-hydroxamate ABC transporter substrate-binding protein [Clostridium argentinense]NFP73256.1 iron-hydroxamate ABC transporter substrate-binding pro